MYYRQPFKIIMGALLMSLLTLSMNTQAQFAIASPGSFVGTLPCADCPGIHWHLDLWPDGRFHLRREYLERDKRDDDLGLWRVNPADGSLLLFAEREAPLRLAPLDKSTLRLLDTQGKTIESTLSYELRKLPHFSPARISLRLDGEFRYFADAANIKVCRNGHSYPVLMEGAYLDIERRYLSKDRAHGEASTMYVQLEASIVNRQAMEGEGPAQSLEVQRFISDVPAMQCERAMSTATLADTYWRLSRVNGQALPRPEGSGEEVHLTLRGSDKTVSGFAGCNRFKGHYSTNQEKLSFTPLASTMMACPESQMHLEQEIHQNLSGITSWKIQGQTLELYNADKNSSMEFEAVYVP